MVNKTAPTAVSIQDFLNGLTGGRREEAEQLIELMREITAQPPVLWGPSIIGFGTQHYKYDSGREGDMPQLAFSPRKTSLTVYFSEGFDRYSAELAQLGAHTVSVSCVYIRRLKEIDMKVLRRMLEASYRLSQAADVPSPPTDVAGYIANIPPLSRPKFDELRELVRAVLPEAQEVLSYGIVGYRMEPHKRARVYISGWKDHLGMYPIPHDEALMSELTPYIKGKGTLWFKLETPLPRELIERTVRALIS